MNVEYGSQFFQPANFFLGEGERQTTGLMAQFVERLVNGLNFGLMLALASIGLSLIFGTTGLTNFAHGELVTLGAVIAWAINVKLGLNLILATIIAVVIGAGIGVLNELGNGRVAKQSKYARGLRLLGQL